MCEQCQGARVIEIWDHEAECARREICRCMDTRRPVNARQAKAALEAAVQAIEGKPYDKR